MSDEHPAEGKLRNLRAQLDRHATVAAEVERVLIADRDDSRDRYRRTGDDYHRGRHDQARQDLALLRSLTGGERGIPLYDQPELAQVDAKVWT